MAGSAMTFTYDEGYDGGGRYGAVKKLTVSWTSDDATGAVSGTTRKIVGRLIKAVTDPGSAAPTDDYDITITDEEGVDVLAACQSNLTNRDTTNSEQVYFLVLDAAGTPLAQSVHPVVCDALTVAVANAGNAKTGQLVLYYAPGA
jgi:hypothetical protein